MSRCKPPRIAVGDSLDYTPNDLVFDIGATERESKIFIATGEPIVVGTFGLGDDDVIYLEVVEFSPTLLNIDFCNCKIQDLQVGSVLGVNRIRCTTCSNEEDGSTVKQFVRLTERNPLIKVQLPKGTYYRFNWVGSQFGNTRVRFYDSTAGFAAGERISNGCPCVQYEDEPELWVHTGQFKCDVARDMLIWEYRGPDNAGPESLIWLDKEPLTWVDTGWIRELCTPSDTNYEKQQIDNCGDIRWVSVACMRWSYTGAARLEGSNIQRQLVNDFGRFRWENLALPVATAALVPTSGPRDTTYNSLTTVTGWAFRSASDDAAATVSVTHPITGTCYVYPTRRPDAPVEVYNAAHTAVVGYARADPLGGRLQFVDVSPVLANFNYNWNTNNNYNN